MKKIILVLVVCLMTNFAKAQKPGVVVSDKPGWHKIGQITADFKMESESIVVLGADQFKSIKLKVKDASINIVDLKIYYETGEIDDIPVKSELKPGSETRVMEVKNTLDIKKVVFTYKTLPNNNKDKAEVELYGLK